MEYYGDSTRWFIATVVDIADPLEMGRVRVRIHGIHSESVEDIPTSDLPFATVMSDVKQGGVSGIGSNIGLKENAQVFGIFLDGKSSQVPLVLGSLTKMERTPEHILKEYVEEDDFEQQIIEQMNTTEEIGRVQRFQSRTSSSIDSQIFSDADTNIEKAFRFMKSGAGGFLGNDRNRGAIAAGIVGNLIVESGQGPGLFDAVRDSTEEVYSADRPRFDIWPDAINKKEGSIGIAQWNPSEKAGHRQRELRKFASDRNLSFLSLTAQLQFIKSEIFGKSWTGSKYGLLDVGSGIDGTDEACRLFEKYYERPAEGSTQKRIDRARDCYREYEDNG
tara:strand:- start:5879 stop:6877 length:999 start_codon:yes stop_codon:yes gene_type:complete